MDVTGQLRHLERAGFAGCALDRAVALAGSRRLVYAALLDMVEQGAATPEEALRQVERRLAGGGL